jgi:quinol monooxygenase YgiN
MYGKLLKLVAKPGMKNQVLDFLRWDAAVARDAEPGTRRFDIWDAPDNSDAIYLYEAYTDERAFTKGHQANAPYKHWETELVPKLIPQPALFDWTESLISNADITEDASDLQGKLWFVPRSRMNSS